MLKRHINNPILQAADIPYPASLVFNAGVAKYQGRYVMVFRNDYGCTAEDWQAYREGRRVERPAFATSLGLAFSDDGVRWQVEPRPCWQVSDEEVLRVYDPRITVIDEVAHVCFAMDTRHGLRGGVARTEDFSRFEILSLSAPDNRNMVLFPEKISGHYWRLERPFPVYSRGGDRFDIWTGVSPDLKFWGEHQLLLGVEDVSFANDKLGPAAPPIRTRHGWLTTFHAVWRDEAINLGGWEKSWKKRYDMGLMLLDLENPAKVIGRCPEPILRAEAAYERQGFRNDVIFAGGMILEDSGEVKIYYGAADTVEALAIADLGDLLAACRSSGS